MFSKFQMNCSRKNAVAGQIRVWLNDRTPNAFGVRETESDQQQRAAIEQRDRQLVRRRTRIGEQQRRNECPPLRNGSCRTIRNQISRIADDQRRRWFRSRGSSHYMNYMRWFWR